MSTVTLRNGSEEFEPFVRITMLSLRQLFDEQPIVAYELVMKCRDTNHKLFGNTGDILEQRGLIEPSGRIHDSVVNVVLSAVDGDGLEMHLRSPLKE